MLNVVASWCWNVGALWNALARTHTNTHENLKNQDVLHCSSKHSQTSRLTRVAVKYEWMWDVSERRRLIWRNVTDELRIAPLSPPPRCGPLCAYDLHSVNTPPHTSFIPLNSVWGMGRKKDGRASSWVWCISHVWRIALIFLTLCFCSISSLCRPDNGWLGIRFLANYTAVYMTIERNEALSRSLCKNSLGARFCWFNLYNDCASFSFMVKNDSVVPSERGRAQQWHHYERLNAQL